MIGMNLSPAMEVFRAAWSKGLNVRLVSYAYKNEIQIYFQITGDRTRYYVVATSMAAITKALLNE